MHDSGLIRETAQTHIPSIKIRATMITKMISSRIVERRQNHVWVGRSLDVREIVLEEVGPPLKERREAIKQRKDIAQSKHLG